MFLILRGHIRKSFDNKNLLELIEQLYSIDKELHIFIHTWNIKANNLSWRQIEEDNTVVDENTIFNYFEHMSMCIKHIIIEDDKLINLSGNTEGKVCKSNAPTKGYKNLWYGNYKIMDFIYNNYDTNTNILNTRFDITNFNLLNTNDDILSIWKNNMNRIFTKNIFIEKYYLFGKDIEFGGCCNLFIGNIGIMYKLLHSMYFNFDKIALENSEVIHQEFLIYRENNELFNK